MLGIDPQAARYTWSAALVLLALCMVYLLRQALLVFVIALLLAYLLYPLMDLFDRHLPGKTRTPALAMTYVLVIGLLATFGVLVGSVVADQAANLTARAPALLDQIRQKPEPSPQELTSLKSQVIGFIADQVRQHYNDVAMAVPRIAIGALSASRNLIYLIIIPILSFFLLRDGRDILETFFEMLGSGHETARDTLSDVHELLLMYMRSLLLLCCAAFVSYSIVLSAIGVQYAMLLASIGFALEFIPLVGPLSAAAIIIVVAVISGYPHVWWVVIFLGAYRLLQDYVLTPLLMSKGVALHPLMIIFGVLAGGEIGGVAGIFLSIPVLALIRLMYHHLKKVQTAKRLSVTGEVV